ncbi:MAG: N-acetylmuramoyl-L-alanine amidase [Bacteroidetes bacterium]|nr:N-acetylmuramoyl-L-alanine amidase [Bacteroidota bacterium]
MQSFRSGRKYLILLPLIFTCSCVHNPYYVSNKMYKKQAKQFSNDIKKYPLEDSINSSSFWAGTTNFGLRKPNFVIIHHTDQSSCEQTLKTFTMTKTQVSAHYVICKDGTIFHMLNDYFRAWHAGVSQWGNLTDVNSASIGIELDNDAHSIFPDVQIQSLLKLLSSLKKKYNIPTANFIGHADIAPGRKVDPSRFFPWKTLAENGFGYWYDTTNLAMPDHFNALLALRIIGYNIQDSVNAIQSFKIHFTPNDSTQYLTEGDQKILFSLERKYQ